MPYSCVARTKRFDFLMFDRDASRSSKLNVFQMSVPGKLNCSENTIFTNFTICEAVVSVYKFFGFFLMRMCHKIVDI